MKGLTWVVATLLLSQVQGCSHLTKFTNLGNQNSVIGPRYPVEANQPLGHEHGLRFDFTLLTQHLDILVLEGAELCFPATVVQAQTRENRINNEMKSGLLFDAANDIIIQRSLLARLENQLNYVKRQQTCQLANTPPMSTPGDIGKRVSALLNVDNQFVSDSHALNPKYVVRLSQAVELVSSLSDYKLLITGHADISGNTQHNLVLSKQRAEQVARYLNIMGIDNERIDISAVGSSQPLFNGNNASVRLVNRRVSIELVESIIQATRRGDNE